MVGRTAAALVGRGDSLDVLSRALKRADGGSPSVVLVTGETGVGKTRLVRELLATHEVTQLVGGCVPMAGDPLPFAPLTQGLRRIAGHGVVRQELSRSAALARLLPGSGPAAPPAATAVGAAAQFGLFQSVLDLLGKLGAARPVVHVVEDLHWADRSTLDLLRYLATNLASERVLLLATYRDDAVAVGSRLAEWLAEVGRLEITERVDLARLGEGDAARLITDLTGRAPDPALVASTLARSAGNPLFIEHLVLQGRTDGPLPATLHELLRARVAALPDQASSVLRALAVLGRAVKPDILAATLGQSVEDVEAAARPALDQHVLELRDEDRIGLRHPAFGEVVYAALLPGERRRLHGAAASALEGQAGAKVRELHTTRSAIDARSGELARHWLQAGDLPRALDAAVAAGEAAERMFAFADAQACFARAAELTLTVESPHDRVWLLSRAASAASLVGDSEEAIRLGEVALAESTAQEVRADLSHRLGTYHYVAGRGQESERWLRRALGLLPDGEQSVLAARLHAGLALYAAAWSRLDEAEMASMRALEIAELVGARSELSRAHNALGLVAVGRGRPDEAVAHLRESLAVAKESGNADDLASAYINLTHVLRLAGRLDEVVDVCREGIPSLTRMGLSRHLGSLLRANACDALISSGRLPEAAALVAETLALHPRGIIAAPVLMQAGRLATIAGDLHEAAERCEQARAIMESEGAPDAWIREIIQASATVELWAGRPGDAFDLVTDGLDRIAGTDEESFGGPLVAIGLRALADQGETHRDHATRRRLASAVPALLAGSRGSGGLEDPAYWAWHEAELSRLDRRRDPEPWVRMAAEWDRIGQPFPAIYARWREAEARLDAGVDALGIAAVRQAHDAAVRLGAARLRDEVSRLAQWHRIDLTSAPHLPIEAGDAAHAALGALGLTAREREVLGGLAAGRTNREIAEELFISVKTASVHVSNILRKLDVTGRQEAARVAHRLGIRG